MKTPRFDTPGAPARPSSSTNMSTCVVSQPGPPYSFGQLRPIQPRQPAPERDRRKLRLQHDHRLVQKPDKRNRLIGRFMLGRDQHMRSEEHTSELQSLMRISYAVFCLTKNTITILYIHI